MNEPATGSAKLPNLRKPAIALAISVGAIVVGSAICMPGICGCASWIGLVNTDSYGTPFLILTMIGVLGVPVSIGWLMVSSVCRKFSRNR
jgi:hypothetical protein